MNLRSRIIALACALLLPISATAGTKVAIGYTPNAEVATAYVAKEQGFFAKRGLDVDLVPVAINSTLPAALMSGSITFGTVSPPVFIQAVDGGIELLAVSGLSVTSKTATGAGIVARTGSNIATAKDLVGKKVGAPGLGAVLHVMARRWLMENGVDPSKVTFVEAMFPTHGDLLKAGTVDAVVTVDPFLSRMVGAGAGTPIVNLLANMPDGEAAQFYAASGAWVKANAGAAKAFKESIVEAAEYMAKNPDGTREAIGKYLKLPPEVLKTIPLPKVDPVITAKQLDFWVEVMKKQDMVRGTIDTKKLIAQ